MHNRQKRAEKDSDAQNVYGKVRWTGRPHNWIEPDRMRHIGQRNGCRDGRGRIRGRKYDYARQVGRSLIRIRLRNLMRTRGRDVLYRSVRMTMTWRRLSRGALAHAGHAQSRALHATPRQRKRHCENEPRCGHIPCRIITLVLSPSCVASPSWSVFGACYASHVP